GDRRTNTRADDGEGYLIPSAKRASFPPGFDFLLSSFLECGALPPSACSMFLTIATRRGPISLRNRSSVKRNAGAPQLKAYGPVPSFNLSATPTAATSSCHSPAEIVKP